MANKQKLSWDVNDDASRVIISINGNSEMEISISELFQTVKKIRGKKYGQFSMGSFQRPSIY